MRGMNSASVDLIYLDPPFNSDANYAAPIGSKAAGAAFKDTWTLADVDIAWLDLIEAKHPALRRVIQAAMTKSDRSYLIYMAARLLEMRRILKPTGSIYLHCDPTMSHYLKLVMDAIFGRGAFRNEIIWCYSTSGRPKRFFAKKHDVLLFYSLGQGFWNDFRIPIPEKYLNSHYKQWDDMGNRCRIRTDHGKTRIYYPDEGMTCNDWWDIPYVNSQADERTGYPTQKPLALLRRIILASSDKSDVVFDPFCGCATACIAAELEHREWVGIDISPTAADLVKDRMRREVRLFYRGVHRTDIPLRTDIGKIPKYNAKENRTRLYGEQAGNCQGCGTHFESKHLTVDHIIPRTKGGTDHIDNLQLLCGYCNSVKGNRDMEYLKARLAA